MKKKKQASLWKNTERILYNKLKKFFNHLQAHPLITAAGIYLIFLLIFQRNFLLSGDVWAETHMEYLQNAISGNFSTLFTLGWAGYLAVIPSFLVKIFVTLGGPIGYIDYYYQFIIVFFAVSVSAYTTNRINKDILGGYFYRLLFGLGMLMLLHEKSTFTFINVWYVGFVPIILLGLVHRKMSTTKQILYSFWGILIAVSKPSLILLPFVVYRAYKTREYISNSLIAIAIILQTYLMLFKDPRQTGMNVSHDILLTLKAIFVGAAIELLKLFRIKPNSLLYLCASLLVLVCLFVIAVKKIGFLRSGIVLFGLLFSVYSYVLAPDSTVYTSIKSYQDVYYYNFKIQREYLIYIFLLILLFISFSYLADKINVIKSVKLLKYTTPIIAILIVIRLFIPIDVQSSGTASNINQFRPAMNAGESVCVPTPPTPAYFPNALWQYSSNIDICHARNFNFTPDYGSMNTSISSEYSLVVPNDTPFPLKTMYIVIKNINPQTPTEFKLTEVQSGVLYYGHIPARDKEQVNFIAINVSGQPYRKSYNFILTGPSNLFVGRFKDHPKLIYYPFFGETREPNRRIKH
jgi:hypothetical protein